MAAGLPGDARRNAGAGFFEGAFGISTSRSDPKGVYAGLVHLGCGEDTEFAWQASQHQILCNLETHFARHDYLLGGRPSLADYGLMGPLYAHLYRDAVPGFYLRTHFPLTTEWVERTNGEGALNARAYGQKLYSLSESGELIGRGATSDDGQWLPDDTIPETLMPIIGAFFDEMWPVLKSASERIRTFAEGDEHSIGDELPGKTFTATPGFFDHQLDDGPLTHPFEIGGVKAKRMVVPYQIWMWQRICDAFQGEAIGAAGNRSLAQFLGAFNGGSDFFNF